MGDEVNSRPMIFHPSVMEHPDLARAVQPMLDRGDALLSKPLTISDADLNAALSVAAQLAVMPYQMTLYSALNPNLYKPEPEKKKKMIWQKVTMKTTSLIISILVISLGIYDLFAVISSHGQASISSFFFQLGFQAPFCVFVVGFICGHFFGYMRLEKVQ